MNWMTIVLMAFACVGFIACGSDDDDEENYSSNKKTDETETTTPVKKTVLTTGVYYDKDCPNGLENELLAMEAAGDYKGISKAVKEKGTTGFCTGAILVEEGNLYGWVFVFASLSSPGNDCVVVKERTYGTTRVYYYVERGPYPYYTVSSFPVKWEGDTDELRYENKCFIMKSGNTTRYYKLVN